jgi:aspartate aminotransferase-like enzyme
VSDFFDLSQLGQGFHASRPTSPPVPSLESMAALLRLIDEEQRREHRTVFCRPECADRIRAGLDAAGLTPWVDVVASELVDEGRAYISHTPLGEDGEPLLIWPGELR